MSTRQLDLVRQNNREFSSSLDRIWENYRNQSSSANLDETVVQVARGNVGLEGLGSETSMAQWSQLEAIILAELRPAYLVQNDQIMLNDSPVEEDPRLVEAISSNKQMLEDTIKSVGRVNLFNHFTLSFAGTGWLIDDGIAITNRHVARVFAQQNSLGNFDFRNGAFGRPIDARLDYVEQHNTSSITRRADVFEVLYIAEDSQPDIAFLRVDNIGGVTPLTLRESPAPVGLAVAAVGYPASDGGRNDPALMYRLFSGIYDVKRFAPGLITDQRSNDIVLTADYSSLGGNSGSPVIDLETGEAVALHFAGAFRDANFSVASDVVAAARAALRTSVLFDATDATNDVTEDPRSAPTELADRQGFNPHFLGNGDLTVAMPGSGKWTADIAEVEGDESNVLRYTHFSVVQCASRRLPLFTAVNIDGEKAISLKRKGSWKTDGRISEEHQVGNVLYKHNPLDRGHLVRRKDPGWGDTTEEAQRAEIDTFHYTNCAPQHKNLNQRDWVGLEDHILESAETHGFKASVLTGPVFRDDDKRLRNQPGAEDIPIPEEFWKVVVMINESTRKLSATGYVLTHGPMIRGLTEASFLFGEFKTYQVQIAKIEQETGLDFGALKQADPLGVTLNEAAVFASVVRPISGSEGFVLST